MLQFWHVCVVLLSASSAAIIGDESAPKYRTNVDSLTIEYLRLEQQLWSRLNSGAEVRPNVLPDIYAQHATLLARDFGESGAVWELGIRLHEKTISDILAINGTASSLPAALEHQHYEAALALAQSAVNQTVDAAQSLFKATIAPGFWSHISTNVSGCCDSRRRRRRHHRSQVFAAHSMG